MTERDEVYRDTADEAALSPGEQSALCDVGFTFAGQFFADRILTDEGYTMRVGIPVDYRIGNHDYSYPPHLSNDVVEDEMLSHPIADRDKILKRQEVLKSLIASGQTERLLGLADDADTFCEGLFQLFILQDIEENAFTYSPTFTLYEEYVKGTGQVDFEFVNRADKRPGIFYKEDGSMALDVRKAVKENAAVIHRGYEAVDELANALASIGDDAFTETADNLREIAATARVNMTLENILSPQIKDDEPWETATRWMCKLPDTVRENFRYIYSEHGYIGPEFGWAAAFRERLEDIRSVLEIARRISTEGWQEVSFNKDKPEVYQAGWNILRPRAGQVPNGSVADKPVTVLAAANGSGKTFYMESDLLAHVVAQSTGFAPIAGGNFHIYDSFGYMGRVASSSRWPQLGAFSNEMNRWREVLGDLGKRPYLYIDEGASTTSPEEQAAILLGLARYVAAQGGRVMLATHNELVAAAVDGVTDGAIYHFKNNIDESTGQLISAHELRSGEDDSRFIALARACDFPGHFLTAMERYLDGSFDLSRGAFSRRLPAVRWYSDRERANLKRRPVGLKQMFPEKALNPLLLLLSQDAGAYHTVSGELLDKAVFHASPLEPAAVLERQRSISRLVEADAYAIVAGYADQLRDMDLVVRSIAQGNELGLNRALNPIFDTRKPEQIKTDEPINVDPAKALAFLRLNQMLLGDDFPWDDDVAFVTNQLKEHDKLSERFIELQANAMRLLDAQNEVQRKQRFDAQSPKYEVELANRLWGERVDCRRQMDTIKESIRTVEDEVGRRMVAADSLFASGKVKKMTFADFSDAQLTDLLVVLAADSRKIGVQRSAESSHDSREAASILGQLFTASFLAHSLVKVPDNDRALESLLTLSNELDAVHLIQSAHYISERYRKIKSAIDASSADAATDTVDNLTTPDDRRAVSQFRSDLSPSQSWRASERVFRGLFKSMLGGRDTDFVEEIDRLHALTDLAKLIKAHQYAPVVFNETGEVALKAVESIVSNDPSQIANDFNLDPAGHSIKLLTGTHGSGKTFYQKTVVPAVLMAQAFGYAPARAATMPFFDRVAYIDRVAQDQASELSAGMKELEYWKELLQATQTGGLILAAVDEAGSSTSPKYQAAFTAAIAREFSRLGHLLIMATHNHEAAGVINSASDVVDAGHFADEGNGVNHKLMPGLEGSHALDSARQAKLPEGLLDAIELQLRLLNRSPLPRVAE